MKNRYKYSHQLDIDELMKEKVLVDGQNKKCKVSIKNYESEIKVTIDSTLEDGAKINGLKYLKLSYRVTKDSPIVKFKISILDRKSNYKYGGSRLYFMCPWLNSPCKIIYLCDITHVFFSRNAHLYIDDIDFPVTFDMPIKNNDEFKLFFAEKYKVRKARIKKQEEKFAFVNTNNFSLQRGIL